MESPTPSVSQAVDGLCQLDLEEQRDSTVPFRFLDLPSELRNAVYRVVLLELPRPQFNPEFTAHCTEWYPFWDHQDDSNDGEMNPHCAYLHSFPYAVFAVNRQVREEALDIINSAKHTWIILRSNLSGYASRLSAKGFPIAFTGPVNGIKHPLVTLELVLPEISPRYPFDSFAVPAHWMSQLVRAINVTDEKPGAILTVTFHELPGAKFSPAPLPDLVATFSNLYEMRQVKVAGVDNILKTNNPSWNERFPLGIAGFLSCGERLPSPGYVLEMLNRVRPHGRTLCNEGCWYQALEAYVDALALIRDYGTLHPDLFFRGSRAVQRDVAEQLALFASNAGLCMYKLGFLDTSIGFHELAIRALRNKKNWRAKVFFRRGITYAALDQHRRVAIDLLNAHRDGGQDDAVVRELQSVKTKLAELYPTARDPLKECKSEYRVFLLSQGVKCSPADPLGINPSFEYPYDYDS
ncbi:hypothetical protein NA57DRAFT_80952 [Rhizodiscina lignyota]|uniref:Uncharacterized protein n=1 Tax=Rhizodiscina lignyota TaxID=1504668 RepID=A0A9P4I8E9_9PEZI|nr:hypothetical protein NA57DRAFT_80952 [Rhizodiscina lignyota]